MTAHRNLQRNRLSMIVACLVATTGATAVNGQDEERVFRPGELVKPGGGETYRILQCRPEKVSRDIECEFVLWKNGGAASRKLWMMASQIAAGEARVKEAEELAAMTDAPAPPVTADPSTPPVDTPQDSEEAPLPAPNAEFAR